MSTVAVDRMAVAEACSVAEAYGRVCSSDPLVDAALVLVEFVRACEAERLREPRFRRRLDWACVVAWLCIGVTITSFWSGIGYLVYQRVTS